MCFFKYLFKNHKHKKESSMKTSIIPTVPMAPVMYSSRKSWITYASTWDFPESSCDSATISAFL